MNLIPKVQVSYVVLFINLTFGVDLKLFLWRGDALFTWALHGVCEPLQTPTVYLSEIIPRYIFYRRFSGPLSWCECGIKDENSCIFREFNPGHAACNVTIFTELSWKLPALL
jgi:hypothetical protein